MYAKQDERATTTAPATTASEPAAERRGAAPVGDDYASQSTALVPPAEGGALRSARLSGVPGLDAVMRGAGVVREGQRGDAVRAVQEVLTGLGHDCGVADGIFGRVTGAGVRSFQRAVGLAADAIVGPKTLGAMDARAGGGGGGGATPPATTTPKTPTPKTPTPPATPGGATTTTPGGKATPSPPATTKTGASTPSKGAPPEKGGKGGEAPPATTSGSGPDPAKVQAIYARLSDPSTPAADIDGLLASLLSVVGVSASSATGLAALGPTPISQALAQGGAGGGGFSPVAQQLLNATASTRGYLSLQFPPDFQANSYAEAKQRIFDLDSQADAGDPTKRHPHENLRGALHSMNALYGFDEIVREWDRQKAAGTVHSKGLAAATLANAYVGATQATVWSGQTKNFPAVPGKYKEKNVKACVGSELLWRIHKETCSGGFLITTPEYEVIRYDLKRPDWCGIFANWIFKQVGFSGTWGNGGAGAPHHKFKAHGSSSKYQPKAGDMAYAKDHFQHMCVVTRVDGDTVHTVDGNTGAGAGGRGGKILAQKRSRSFFSEFYEMP
ncbi:MAG: peptidoglycan-binding protein [Myxococcales bacterium]|nr:peptidoglycan-binding protein [Myxococcales bacterium]MCB9734008.1 peptidoglycan-binding protein [Deltaproteobacteria bacterium]